MRQDTLRQSKMKHRQRALGGAHTEEGTGAEVVVATPRGLTRSGSVVSDAMLMIADSARVPTPYF